MRRFSLHFRTFNFICIHLKNLREEIYTERHSSFLSDCLQLLFACIRNVCVCGKRAKWYCECTCSIRANLIFRRVAAKKSSDFVKYCWFFVVVVQHIQYKPTIQKKEDCQKNPNHTRCVYTKFFRQCDIKIKKNELKWVNRLLLIVRNDCCEGKVKNSPEKNIMHCVRHSIVCVCLLYLSNLSRFHLFALLKVSAFLSIVSDSFVDGMSVVLSHEIAWAEIHTHTHPTCTHP